MNSHPQVSIIVPTFNGLAYTKLMLESLRRHTALQQAEIIFVDNNSKDGTQEFLASLQPQCKLIQNSSNRNFAGACNQGAAIATCNLLLFLNNDIVVTRGWLDSMLLALEQDPSIGIVGNRQLFPDSTTIHHCGILFDEFKHPKHYLEGADWCDPRTKISRSYPSVTGSCFLTPKKIFQGLGGFDESYINGYEDIDYCMKAAESGLKSFFCAESLVFHHTSVSEGRRDYNLPNWQLFHSRWNTKIEISLDSQRQNDRKILQEYFSKPKTKPRVAVCIEDAQDVFRFEVLVEFVKNLRAEGVRYGFDGEVLLLAPDTLTAKSAHYWICSHDDVKDSSIQYGVDLYGKVDASKAQFDRHSFGLNGPIVSAQEDESSAGNEELKYTFKIVDSHTVNLLSEVFSPLKKLEMECRLDSYDIARAQLRVPQSLRLEVILALDADMALASLKERIENAGVQNPPPQLCVCFVLQLPEQSQRSYKLELGSSLGECHVVIEPIQGILNSSLGILEASDRFFVHASLAEVPACYLLSKALIAKIVSNREAVTKNVEPSKSDPTWESFFDKLKNFLTN